MRKIFLCALTAMLTTLSFAIPKQMVEIEDFSLNGRIEGENVTFRLSFNADARKKDSRILLLEGNVGIIKGDLESRKYKFTRDGNRLYITFEKKGRQRINLSFASLAVKTGDWRATSFKVTQSTIRQVTMICDRPDLEVQFPGALKTARTQNLAGETEITAYLGVADTFQIAWKPEVRKLDAETVVSCEANTIASASVGVLRQDTVFTYSLAQGSLEKLSLRLPDDLSVTEVVGNDILQWAIDKTEDGTRRLNVQLNRRQEQHYKLQVKSELVLSEFPCNFKLPMPMPLNVIRASGFLMVGTDSAIKLLVGKASGLTQIDLDAFPAALMRKGVARRQPRTKVFSYQYANMPFLLNLSADDIVTAYSSEDQIVLRKQDDDLVMTASVELDVRDAPARDIEIKTDTDWIVANVEGGNVSDYTVRDENGRRFISIFFKQAIMGKMLFNVRLEKTLGDEESSFKLPAFSVRNAESERGVLVLSAEKGVRFEAGEMKNLREIHTKSTTLQVRDTVLAYRFKNAGWELSVKIQQTDASIYCEIFHLVSLGESVLYGSSSLTYHIGDAPVRTLLIKLPKEYQHVEFTGRDIRNREEKDGIWTITLQEKIMGDFTLLVTYDQQFSYDGGEILLGGVGTSGICGETGFIALAGRASLSVENELVVDSSIIAIDHSEIPEEYELLINDPVLRAYKYIGTPHTVKLDLNRYATQSLLGQVADHTTLSTRISDEGEAVTTATYFIKNTSSQYLGVELPKDARLWSVQVDGKTVQALKSADSKSKILIPLERNLDPNKPLRVKIEYAESRKPLKWLGGMKFSAPVCAAQSVFSKWHFTVPEDYSLAEHGGNMMNVEVAGTPGALGLLYNMATAYRDIWGWMIPDMTLVFFICLIAFQRGRGAKAIIPSTLCVPALVISIFIAGNISGMNFLPDSWNKGFLTATSARELHLTKVVSLAGSGLETDLRIVAAWIGGNGSLAGLIGGTIAGLGLCTVAFLKRRKVLLLSSAGLTLLTWGFTQTATTLAIVSATLTVLLPLAIAVSLVTLCYRTGRKYPKPPRVRHAKSQKSSPTTPPSNNEVAADDNDKESKTDKKEEERGMNSTNEKDISRQKLSAGGATLAGILTILLSTGVLKAEKINSQSPQKQCISATENQQINMPGIQIDMLGEDCAPSLQSVRSDQQIMRSVDITVDAPSTINDEEKTAKVSLKYKFETEKAKTIKLLSAKTVLVDINVKSNGWHPCSKKEAFIVNRKDGSFLVVKRKGEYSLELTCLVPVKEASGDWRLDLYLPPNLRNKVSLNIPEQGFNVQSADAVLLKTEEAGTGSLTSAVFGDARNIAFSWKPQVRKAKLEKVVFFSHTQTEVLCESGVVNLSNRIHYQVARGEIQSLEVDIPKGMSVTSVNAEGLSTWRFDPETHRLEAMLGKPVSGSFVLTIITQIARERLPYDVEITLPHVEGAAYQRGTLAVASPDNVQVRISKSTGLHSMNISDFQYHPQSKNAGIRTTSVKRAFRYHQLPVNATLHAEKVLPEIRVEETASLDISDERIVLSSKLNLSIAKAGVFTAELELPNGYEIESLTGQDLSHWDEVSTPFAGVIVHFKRQVLGSRMLNLVLMRAEKNIDENVSVPRIGVRGAMKHKGILTVSGERGVRLTTVDRQGVSELNPRELGIKMPGYLAFRILRSNWTINLKADILDPVIKVNILQRIDLNEGVLTGHCYIRHTIDNAGCKQFFLKSPRPGVNLSILGNDIARIQCIDEENGIWRIDLHNKVEREYTLEASYQISFDPKAGKTKIEPLLAKNVAAQKGYLAIMSGGRLQIQHGEIPNGLREENSRSIPGNFGAGDLSDAIFCYSVTATDYTLDISVIRHSSATVLPATVKNVNMDSVVSADRQIVTRMRLEMLTGDMRLLKMWLPEGSKVWSVYVNGKSTRPLLKGDAYLIPLDTATGEQSTELEVIYGGNLAAGGLRHNYKINGPRMNLPLNNIQWSMYMPPNFRYHKFDGTMNHKETSGAPVIVKYNAQQYKSAVQHEASINIQKAEEVLQQGERYAQAGQQIQAKQAFEQAMNYSQGDFDFNADARIQYRNVAKNQAIVGLVNRRNKLKKSINIQDEKQSAQIKGFNGGNWSIEYQDQITQSLTVKDNASLNDVAERILDQQAASRTEAPAIRLTLPASGEKLDFTRSVQINPNTEMTIEFKASMGGWMRKLSVLLSMLGLFCVILTTGAVSRVYA